MPNMGSNSDLLRHKEVVFWRLTYILSVTNKFCKHDSLQVMKFVFWHSTYNLSVLNMDLNMTCAKSRNSCICDRLWVYLYWTSTGNMTSGKWLNKCIRAWHASHQSPMQVPNLSCANWNVSCAFALDLQLICLEYDIESWLALSDEIRV